MRYLAPLALALATAAALAACGGGGSSTSAGGGDLVAEVEAACTDLTAVQVWLPAHLADTGMSSDEGTALARRAEDSYKASLEELEPPADLQPAVDQLIEALPYGPPSLAAEKRFLRREAGLFAEIGATKCEGQARAALLVIAGESPEDAYRKVGQPLPARPDGW